ncbi:type VI secretion system protein TssA [Pendulispora rubella]|uniref:Type VI secretion system protein TssA n=1 Tax=Pendulispora rubella TaxID=2741070 RepID=A0ABZ2KZX0_9BACT
MTTFDEEIRSRTAPYANPLSGTPTGSDLSYDPEFERVAAEIEKLSNLTGGSVDWMLVSDDASRMLTERTKDFRLAGWLTVAKAQREGWRGVAEGLFAMQALVDGFWDNMFPPLKRARARAGVLTWLWETLDGIFTPRAVSAADADALKALETLVTELDEKLGAKLGDLNPGVGRFRIVVREKVRALPAPPPPKVEAPVQVPPLPSPPPPGEGAMNGTNGVPVPVAVAAVAQVAAVVQAVQAVSVPAAPAAAPTGGSLEELQDAASKWQDGLLELAKAARATAPADPWPFRLLRVATWLTIDGLPEVDKGRKTYARSAPGDDWNNLSSFFEASNWQALVEAAENALASNPFWLDVHRYSAVALEKLERADARDTVGREVVAFLSRMPKLEELEFSDEMPFASPETREWIAAERARWGAAGAGAALGGGKGAEIAAAVVEAVGGIGEGSDVAIAKVLRAAERSDVRSRFVGRLEVARVALDKERYDLAQDVAELLLPEITETLEAWEPALAADALANCLRALQTRNRDEGAVDERESQLFRRLLKLDPEAALRLRAS